MSTKQNSTASVIPADDMVGKDKDEALLASLGYKQELRREFSPIEIFGIGFSIIGLFPSIASVLVFAIPSGAPSMVWGWATCAFFLACISLALAELASAAPTSGGLYYWTFKYSSPKWRNLLSWIVGYANTVGNISGIASVDYACAQQIMAAVSIGSNLTFTPTTPQTFGLYCALLLSHAGICSLAPKYIARLQTLYVVVNVLLCLVIIIGLPAATPKEFMNDANFALGDFKNLTLWPNGFAFIVSFLAPLWTIGGFDGSIHLSEEATNASVAVPWAMICATTIGSVLGWGINVALVFCMGTDLEKILDSPTAQPMATILFNSFGKRGTLAIWSFVIVIQFMMGSSIVTACSRQVFAFSRDGALPLSSWLYHLTNTGAPAPTHAVYFSCTLALLLGLLSFAGSTAISAVFSSSVAASYIAYCIPICARYLGGQGFVKGPFGLGVFSLPISITSVSWMLFTIIVFTFPTTPNPGATGMNYTVVVLGGTIALSVVYYYFPGYGGVYWFRGPVANVGVGEEEEGDWGEGEGDGVEEKEKEGEI